MNKVVYGDSGYLGIEKREEIVSDAHLSSIDYRINRRPSSLQKVSGNSIDWDRISAPVWGGLNQRFPSKTRCKTHVSMDELLLSVSSEILTSDH